ncbi:DUF309 domain-containing protein [Gaiella sp.]|uniref:DUF309 domain-containing protein n=1 Tax=Gaiella sp. TaxID=2663207 RepID=UPI003266FE5A
MTQIETDYRRGLALIDSGQYFAAHESLEDAWRAAPKDERDFFQGLVHIAVAWYQAERRNKVGWQRQLAKARRRLAAYEPVHRGLDVEDLLSQLRGSENAYPHPPPLRLRLTL